MDAQDLFKAVGRVRLELHDAEGNLLQTEEATNLIVSSGKNVIADRMNSTPTMAAMSHMAVGTGITAPAVGDTALGAEVAGSRTALGSTTVAANVITYTCTFGAGVGTGALTEAGIFNAATGGNMLARVTFSVINKGASDSLTITWTVTLM